MRQSATIDGCPFAQPCPPWSEACEGFYCRLPGGRVHLPTPDELQRFCATSRFIECPVNRRRLADRSRYRGARERQS